MYSKIIFVAATLAVALARPQGGQGHGQDHGHAYSSQNIVLHTSHGQETQHKHENAQPAQASGHKDYHHEEHYAHPKYEFSYSVHDPHTHDIKSHHESRDGDVVKGVYRLHEADGTVRIVEYTADKHSGFNAVVRHEGQAKHDAPKLHH